MEETIEFCPCIVKTRDGSFEISTLELSIDVDCPKITAKTSMNVGESTIELCSVSKTISRKDCLMIENWRDAWDYIENDLEWPRDATPEEISSSGFNPSDYSHTDIDTPCFYQFNPSIDRHSTTEGKAIQLVRKLIG